MEALTIVKTNSIQSKRISESRESLDVSKTFSYFINGLIGEKENDCKNNNIQEVAFDLEADNIVVDNQRVTALGERHFTEYSNFYTQTQKWVGVITEVNGDGFIAKLEDLNNSGTFEFGEFFFSEISKEDKPLISLGAVFYWSVGYANDKGQVKKESIIRFQRLPKWTSTEMDNVFDKVKEQIKSSKWL